MIPAKEEIQLFKPYSDIVYTPGKAIPEIKFTEADPVLNKAVAVLTGKESLDQAIADSQKEAAKRKAAAQEKQPQEEPETVPDTEEK